MFLGNSFLLRSIPPHSRWMEDMLVHSARFTLQMQRQEQFISRPFRGHTDAVSSVAISPDGRFIVSGSHDNTICIWDAKTGEIIFGPLPGHTDWVVSVAFSQDGKRVMSFSYDQMIRIWNIERREHISTRHGTVAVLVSISLPLTNYVI